MAETTSQWASTGPASRSGQLPRAVTREGQPLRLLVAVTDPMSLLLLRGQLAAARAAGFDVTVLSAPGELATRLAQSEGVRHLTVDMARGMDPGRDVASLGELVRVLRTIKPHIVNAGTPKAGLLVTIAAWITGVSCRIHTLRGLRSDTAQGASKPVIMATTWLTCTLAHRVICISPSLRRRAVDLGLVPADKAVVLGAGSSNGIDVARFTASDMSRQRARALRAQWKIPADALVLGFVGRVARDKGFVELATAWRTLRKQYPRLHWVVIGPPDPTDPIPATLDAELEEDARVHRLGHVDDMVSAYLMLDMLALPTYREGFGNVLIEAAALELPTVATRVTGCMDAVEHGVTGTLVPARDPEALARAIAAYAADAGLRRLHGHAGRERALRLFDQEALWARMHREYLELAARADLIAPLPGIIHS